MLSLDEVRLQFIGCALTDLGAPWCERHQVLEFLRRVCLLIEDRPKWLSLDTIDRICDRAGMTKFLRSVPAMERHVIGLGIGIGSEARTVVWVPTIQWRDVLAEHWHTGRPNLEDQERLMRGIQQALSSGPRRTLELETALGVPWLVGATA